MSMLFTVGSTIIVIILAISLLRDPKLENKTLIYVLLVLQVILIIIDFIWH